MTDEGDFSEEVAFELRPGKMREQNIPGRENRKYKGLGTGTSLEYLKKIQLTQSSI